MTVHATLAWLVALGAAHLALTWVLYPAAVIALGQLARRLRRRPAAEAPLPPVSVVVATRDEAEVIQARVADLLAGDYPADRLEVIVAVDATATLISPATLRFDDPRVRVVAGDAPGGKCPALNAGVRAATGTVLVFTDSRQRFAADTIRRMVAAITAGGVAATSGRLLLPPDGDSFLVRQYTRFELAIRHGEAGLHSAVGISGSVSAMRRDLWTPLPAGLLLDDLFTPMRLVLAGHRIGFERHALAYETRAVQPTQEYRRKVRTLTGNLQLCAWMPAVLVPWRNPIWVQFTCHKLLRLLTPYSVLLMAGGGTLLGLEAAGPYAGYLLGTAAVVGAAIAVGRGRLAARLRSMVVQAVSIQGAVVVATWNAARGRWDVWSR